MQTDVLLKKFACHAINVEVIFLPHATATKPQAGVMLEHGIMWVLTDFLI
jgi:hypothetical protein